MLISTQTRHLTPVKHLIAPKVVKTFYTFNGVILVKVSPDIMDIYRNKQTGRWSCGRSDDYPQLYHLVRCRNLPRLVDSLNALNDIKTMLRAMKRARHETLS